MIRIQMNIQRNLYLKNMEGSQNDGNKVDLVGVAYEVTREPSFHDSDRLFEALSIEIASLVNKLSLANYKPWLLLVGAPLTTDKRNQIKNYDLAGPARTMGLIDDVGLEQTFRCGDRTRTVGLYQISLGKMPAALQFITANQWALLIFSKRQGLTTKTMLENFYDIATDYGKTETLVALDWEGLALILCRATDVILKTWMGDLYRNVLFVLSYDTSCELGIL